MIPGLRDHQRETIEVMYSLITSDLAAPRPAVQRFIY